MRRNLLLLMLGVSAAAFTVSVESPVFAKGGGSGNSDSGSSGSGSSGSGGGDDNSGSGSGGDDNSGPGSHDSDDDDDNAGPDSGGGSDDNDDSSIGAASNDDNRNGGGGNNAVRPRVQISVDAATRAGLLNGTLVAVDNLGRPLEVEADIRNGQPVLIAKPHGGDAKRNPGMIASYVIVPAAQAPVHQ